MAFKFNPFTGTFDNVWTGTTIAVANGGTGQTTYTDGQLLIGNTTGNTLTKATLTGTSNQITVTNGNGSITLSTPQSIHTGASPTFAGLSLTGAETITSTSATALAIGANGTTNPVLQVDASTASSATGIKIKSAAAAAGVAISVITSGTNENLTIDAAGSGTTTINGTATGQTTIGNTSIAGVALGVLTSGSSSGLTVTDTGTNGANFRFVGNGATTPNKYIRVRSGILQFLSSAYSAILNLSDAGKITLYNSISTVSNGIPSEVATIDSTGLTANVSASTLYAVPASGVGMYRVSAYVVETTAGSLSSTLPNVQIVYTDSDSNTSVTIDATPVLGVAGIGQTGALTANTVGTVSTGVIVLYVKASTTIQYQTVNYASNIAGMTYALRLKLEAM